MVKKNLLKSLSVVMACMMAIMTVACGSNTVENKEAPAAEEEAKESETLEQTLLTSAARAGSSEEAGKVETVYVTANASGAVDEVIVTPITDQLFTGSAVTPEPVVTYRHWDSSVVTLQKDTDYTLDYSNNTDPGEACVYIIGKGEYLGKSATAVFNIVEP